MASPPQTYFFCTKQTKSLLDALQITRNHLHFFEIKKVCQSKNAWGKYCYFVAKTFTQEGCVCFRKLILRHFRTHLDQNPVQSTLFRSFWCPTEHIFWIFWNRLQVYNINIFIKSLNSHVFEHRIDGGASVEILTFEHFGVQLSTFLTLLESSPGA